ncbi:response regulator transcription factor [Microbacterium sp.]|uniref:response regulator transcription factor n=1 Tax=Microbacterium sp. TaxID=51671 RepID=UPI0025FE85F7|nr:response regulator transcription factor [Microbacterium sp.]
MRVLLIEDDSAIAAGILDALRRSGFDAAHAATGAEGLAAVEAGTTEVVLLDLGLPDIDGVEVCRRIRATSTLPVIVVSARDDELDRVLALEMGADDYLVKPFGFRELAARIRAVMRRVTQEAAGDDASSARTLGALILDPRSRRVSLRGNAVHMTAKEFELLEYLTSDPGAVMRRGDILRDVWGTSWYGTTKTLDAHVAAIRKKLGDPAWIEAVRGIGFRFEALL